MASFNIYLHFDGNCRQAMTFYAGIFHASSDFTSFPGHPDRVMHTELHSGPFILMASDMPPGVPFHSGNNFATSLFLLFEGRDRFPLRRPSPNTSRRTASPIASASPPAASSISPCLTPTSSPWATSSTIGVGLMASLNMLIETHAGFDCTGADCQGWMQDIGFRETRVEHLIGPDSMVIGIK